jgi:protein-tyrosine phosphatase
MSEERFTILAVCTANICRSPLMELALAQRLPSERFEVASAGVRGWDAQPMEQMAATEARRLGLDPDAFASRPVNAHLITSADLVLTATRQHRSEVLGLAPAAIRRAFTLREFAALIDLVDQGVQDPRVLVAEAAIRRSLGPAEVDVDDPYRREPEVHRSTADQIAKAAAKIAARLASGPADA